jgi:hypothetical protein
MDFFLKLKARHKKTFPSFICSHAGLYFGKFRTEKIQKSLS